MSDNIVVRPKIEEAKQFILQETNLVQQCTDFIVDLAKAIIAYVAGLFGIDLKLDGCRVSIDKKSTPATPKTIPFFCPDPKKWVHTPLENSEWESQGRVSFQFLQARGVYQNYINKNNYAEYYAIRNLLTTMQWYVQAFYPEHKDFNKESYKFFIHKFNCFNKMNTQGLLDWKELAERYTMLEKRFSKKETSIFSSIFNQSTPSSINFFGLNETDLKLSTSHLTPTNRVNRPLLKFGLAGSLVKGYFNTNDVEEYYAIREFLNAMEFHAKINLNISFSEHNEESFDAALKVLKAGGWKDALPPEFTWNALCKRFAVLHNRFG